VWWVPAGCERGVSVGCAVPCRGSRRYAWEMRSDADGANAAHISTGMEGGLVGSGSAARILRRKTAFDH